MLVCKIAEQNRVSAVRPYIQIELLANIVFNFKSRVLDIDMVALSRFNFIRFGKPTFIIGVFNGILRIQVKSDYSRDLSSDDPDIGIQVR